MTLVPARGSEPAYPDISGAESYAFLEAFTGISRQAKADGVLNYGRIVGTRYERQALAMVREAFAAAGVDEITQDDFPLGWPELVPTRLGLTLTGPDGASLAAPSAFLQGFAKLTPEGGLEADLVDGGRGTAGDLSGLDLKGKIVFVRVPIAWAVFRHPGQETLARLVEEGEAAGLVMALDQPRGRDNRYAVWTGTEGARLSWLNVNGEDGAAIADMLARAEGRPVRARMVVEGEILDPKTHPTANLYGLVRGMSDDLVVLTSHTDSMFQGATDNASGVATLVTLARHYASLPRAERPYSLLFIATGGHHSGPAAGVRYIRDNRKDIAGRAKIVFNLEHMASFDPASGDKAAAGTTITEHGVYVPNESKYLEKVVRDAMAEFGVPATKATARNYVGDLYPWYTLRTPAVCLMQNTYWYHSEADTPDKISPETLGAVAKVFARVIDTLGKNPDADWTRLSAPRTRP
ncbi:MAG: M28 family peptidase [Alphaproteobacteria bacterium]|nr:M28 family peptidase [Alphaproteobacteria bacterium]